MTAADILAFNELKRTVETHRVRKLAPPPPPAEPDEPEVNVSALIERDWAYAVQAMHEHEQRRPYRPFASAWRAGGL